jgi:hypothetical protein
MSLPNSRDQFKEYCLRKLGKPVIQINVSDDQVNDRIDEAVKYWNDNHYDGMQMEYLATKITQEMIDTKTIPLPSDVMSVSAIIPVRNDMTVGADNLFSASYQFRLNDILYARDMNLTYFYMQREYYDAMNRLFSVTPRYQFIRHQNKIRIEAKWGDSGFMLDGFVVLEVYRSVSSNSMWTDLSLMNLTTSLIKQQWGSNLSKYDSVILPGGNTLNGTQIHQEAVEELDKIKESIDTRYSPPPRFFIG